MPEPLPRQQIWHLTGRRLGAYRFAYDETGAASLDELHAEGWAPIAFTNLGGGPGPQGPQGPPGPSSELVPTSVKTGAYTASAGQLVYTDSSAAGFTITLPSAPPNGSLVGVMDVTDAWEVHPVLLAPGAGDTVLETTGLSCDDPGGLVTVQYVAGTDDWRLADNNIVIDGSATSPAVVRGIIEDSTGYVDFDTRYGGGAGASASANATAFADCATEMATAGVGKTLRLKGRYQVDGQGLWIKGGGWSVRGKATIELVGTGFPLHYPLQVGVVPLDGANQWRPGVIAQALTVSGVRGASTVTVASGAAFAGKIGEVISLMSTPTGNTSAGNWIPYRFENRYLKNIAGNVLTFDSCLEDNYPSTEGAVAIWNPHFVENVTVQDLELINNYGDYHLYVQAGQNIVLRNLLATGISAGGGVVFVENFLMENCLFKNTYTSISFSRGCISCIGRNISFHLRVPSPGDGLFVEESFKRMLFEQVDILNGRFYATSLGHGGDPWGLEQFERQMQLNKLTVNNAAGTGGAVVCTGMYNRCDFHDLYIKANGAAGMAPGQTTPALIAVAFNTDFSVRVFSGYIRSMDGAAVYATGSASVAPVIYSQVTSVGGQPPIIQPTLENAPVRVIGHISNSADAINLSPVGTIVICVDVDRYMEKKAAGIHGVWKDLVGGNTVTPVP